MIMIANIVVITYNGKSGTGTFLSDLDLRNSSSGVGTLCPGNYRQDLPQAALLVLFYSQAGFGFFAPQGQHTAQIKVKFGREERT